MINMLEVRCNKDDKIYSLDDLIKLYDYEEDKYNELLKSICCPSCGNENIVMQFNLDVAMIKSKRNSHKKNCDYYGFKVAQIDMKNRIKNKIGFEDLIKDNAGKKLIPKRSLNRILQEDDINVYKLFYGDVVIKKAYSKNEDKYINFSLKAPFGNTIVMSIKTKHMTKEISDNLNNNIDKTLHVKLIGKIVEVNEYKNILLEHPNFLII